MARRIPHRELRNNSSAILREVAGGETIEVTNHGKVVAILAPPPEDDVELYVRKAASKSSFALLPRFEIGESTSDSIDDLRDESGRG